MDIENKVKLTIPSVKITQIQRIQAKRIYERYAFMRNRIAAKNGGNPNELLLFHGTRGTQPNIIYEGEDGFDMRFCTSGMWGVATYFAVNAR